MTPLDWPRYFLFPVIFSTLCIAVAVGGVARWLWSKRLTIDRPSQRQT